eukprot:3129869-Amphidinium_carterae.1
MAAHGGWQVHSGCYNLADGHEGQLVGLQPSCGTREARPVQFNGNKQGLEGMNGPVDYFSKLTHALGHCTSTREVLISWDVVPGQVERVYPQPTDDFRVRLSSAPAGTAGWTVALTALTQLFRSVFARVVG